MRSSVQNDKLHTSLYLHYHLKAICHNEQYRYSDFFKNIYTHTYVFLESRLQYVKNKLKLWEISL